MQPEAAVVVAKSSFVQRTRWLVSDSLTLARRNISHVRQTPERLIDVTVQPVMFTLLFVFVFGGVIDIPGGSYREYIIPGVMGNTLIFSIMGPATALTNDLTKGIIDRFRSLPMSRFAFLTGHLLAAIASTTLAVFIIIGTGLAVGWRIHGSFANAVAGFALIAVFAFSMHWVGLMIGTFARSPESIPGIMLSILFPMMFIASSYVPVAGLPAGLRQIAEFNPLSLLVTSLRQLFDNPTAIPHDALWPLQNPIVSTLIWCGVFLMIAMPLAVHRYRSRFS